MKEQSVVCEHVGPNGRVCGGARFAVKRVAVQQGKSKVKKVLSLCYDHCNQFPYTQRCKERNWKSGSEGAYWERTNGPEDPRANPDEFLTEEDSLWAPSPLGDENEELVEQAKARLGELTSRQFEIFNLLIYERRSQAEIAAILRVSRSTVSEHVDAIIKKLKG